MSRTGNDTRRARRSLGFAALTVAVIVAGALFSLPVQAAFPGANGKIAFERDRDIHAIDPDRSGLINLTRNPGVDRAPAFSPDGQRIAFHSFRRASSDGAEIFVMNADGSGQTRLTDTSGQDPSLAGDLNPAWSHDGRRIAFESSRDGSSRIHVMNADGTGESRLTDAGGAAPAWSPDGRRIAFHRPAGIFVVNTDGSDETQLTSGPGDRSPSWSPDGAWIAFQSTRHGDSLSPEIYVMGADGSGVARVTNNPGRDVNPAFSPDGTKIAFERAEGSQSDIHTIHPDGSGQANLTATGDASNPDWQPVPPEDPPVPPEDPPQVTEIAPAQQKLRRGGAAVFTAQVSGEAEELEWTLPRGGTITGPADQNSVRFRPRPGRETTVRVRAIGPGGVSEVATHTFQAPPMPKAKLARLALRKIALKGSPLVAVGTAGSLAEGQPCSPQTRVVSGRLKVRGCLSPIDSLGDVPFRERGMLATVMEQLGIADTTPTLGHSLEISQQGAEVVSRFTDAYFAPSGKAIVVNEGFNMQGLRGGSVVVAPMLQSILSSDAALGVGEHKLGEEQHFVIRGSFAKAELGRVSLGVFNPPGTVLETLARLKVVDPIAVRIGNRQEKRGGTAHFTEVETKLRLPGFLDRLGGLHAESQVTLEARPSRLVLDQLTIGPMGVRIGGLDLSNFKVGYSREGPNDDEWWRGQGNVKFPGGGEFNMSNPGPPEPPDGIRGVHIKNGGFNSAGAGVTFPGNGIVLYPGVNLRTIGFGLGLDPTRLDGTVTVRVIELVDITGTLVLGFPTSGQQFVLDHSAFPQKQTFTGTTIAVAGQASLALPVNLPVLNLGVGGYLIYSHLPGGAYTRVGGSFEREFVGGRFKAEGSVDGQFNTTNKRFSVRGQVQACVRLFKNVGKWRCGSATGVVSSKAAGACVGLGGGDGTSNLGGVKWWSGGFQIWFFKGECKPADFEAQVLSSGQATTAQAGSPHVVRIRRGDRTRNIRLEGDGAAPLVRVSGPGGQVLESGPEDELRQTKDGRVGIARVEGDGDNYTIVGLIEPRPGIYRIEPLDGSASVERIAEAVEPPDARSRGRVRALGRQRVLRYNIRRRPQQRVTFLEVTPSGLAKEIGTVRGGGRGELRFRPAPARGKSRIVAQFELNDMPTERRRIARFDTPAPRLGKPRRLRVNRTGNRLRVSWRRVPGANRYAVTVSRSGRPQVSRVTRKRTIVVKRVPRSSRGRVSVRALDRRAGQTVREGRPAPARVRRTARPKPNFRPLPRCVERRGKIRCRVRQ